jgi:putative acetyltransferase
MPRTIFCQKQYRKELEEMVRAFLPEAPLWVAVTEDQPIAFMLLTGEHMDALFVDPDCPRLRRGLLIEHALSLTPKLTTNVNEQNEQAVGFYQRMGLGDRAF